MEPGVSKDVRCQRSFENWRAAVRCSRHRNCGKELQTPIKVLLTWSERVQSDCNNGARGTGALHCLEWNCARPRNCYKVFQS